MEKMDLREEPCDKTNTIISQIFHVFLAPALIDSFHTYYLTGLFIYMFVNIANVYPFTAQKPVQSMLLTRHCTIYLTKTMISIPQMRKLEAQRGCGIAKPPIRSGSITRTRSCFPTSMLFQVYHTEKKSTFSALITTYINC